VNETDLLEVLETEQVPGAKFEVVQYKRLKGSENLYVAEKVFFANKANIHLKMIRVTLDKSEVLIEPGALYFMKGDLHLESNMQGLSKSLMRKFTSGETLFQSRIRGTGEIYLEPTFGHYSLFNIDQDALIVDKGAFYAASGGLEVGAKMQSNISSALFGGEGLFQTQIKGSGVVVLVSPVEKSGKSFLQSATSGEGLLQTFTGPGVVWIAPTEEVYKRLGMFSTGFHSGR
jgi:uncharacterized protein (AIM24 family)